MIVSYDMVCIHSAGTCSVGCHRFLKWGSRKGSCSLAGGGFNVCITRHVNDGEHHTILHDNSKVETKVYHNCSRNAGLEVNSDILYSYCEVHTKCEAGLVHCRRMWWNHMTYLGEAQQIVTWCVSTTTHRQFGGRSRILVCKGHTKMMTLGSSSESALH